MATVIVLDTAGDGTFTVPADWSADNQILAIGGGQPGAIPAFFENKSGGGGWGAIANNVSSWIPGQVVNIHVGVRINPLGGSTTVNGDPSWVGSSNPSDPACIVLAPGGVLPGTTVPSKGDTVFQGGIGSLGNSFDPTVCGGAGGAAGINGTGGTATTHAGGNGDANTGGAGGAAPPRGSPGLPGGNGTEIYGTGKGSGGGGSSTTDASDGGNGGKYGGGGGAGDRGHVAGFGEQGAIFITYQPAVAPAHAVIQITGFDPVVVQPQPTPPHALIRIIGRAPVVVFVPVEQPTPPPAVINIIGQLPFVRLRETINWRQTVISQYANSPTLLQIVENLAEYFDPNVNFDAFFDLIWNVDTAEGYGLDVWGRIVGVGRVVHLPGSLTYFGWEEGGGYVGWNQGPFWNGGGGLTQNFSLNDTAFRQLILAKAAANLCDGSIPSINAILRALFQQFGNAYVTDNGDMTITYTFTFPLTPVQLAIILQTGVIPKPPGVSFTVSQP